MCNSTLFKARPVNFIAQRPAVELDRASTATPLFSVIIGVYNDWTPLDQCLRSLSEQTQAPAFEVIVVDDGSQEAAPQFIRDWSRCYALAVVRHAHAGISAARNRGIQASKGSILVFVDADCKFQTNCLAALGETISRSPEHHCFQLRLTGDGCGVVGRAEQLRLITFQSHMLLPNGCIRYLNTAGFAIRRTRVDIAQGLFDPDAVRAEDTFLLANLIEGGVLPWFVGDAIVQHAIPLSLMECFRKDIHSARLEARTYDLIDSKGVNLRVSHKERWGMLLSMWRTSAQRSIGRSAWFVLVVRQGLRWMILFADRCFRRPV